MINIAICDDEENIRIYLSSLVKKQNTECEIAEYASVSEYLLAEREHDILFLDIEMQNSLNDMDQNGMWLAKELRSRDKEKQPIIIFVTGYQEYVFDAFDVGAFQYLLKPVNEQKFSEVFYRAVKQIATEKAQQNRNLVIQYNHSKKVIPYKQVYYIESQNHKVIIHAKEGIFECYAKMEDLEMELSGQFYRIHRGYIINLAHVEEYGKMEVMLFNGDKVPISKYKYDDFKRAYLDHISEEGL